MKNDNTVIRVENLSKRYTLGQLHTNSFRDRVSCLFKKDRSQKERRKIWALRDVSFEVKQGEVLGIIGRNGAGKSTLLKILSRITRPTNGTAQINGRVGSLLEVGTGFHPELTGRENIYLNGAILGMRQTEVSRKFDDIVTFAEIEKFLDTPVKRYSSGMYVRLAFSVAAHLEPEILLVDEVLAVGDASFQKKCLSKMGEVSVQGRTVLFVSHNLAAIRHLCNQAILLEAGKVESRGDPEDIIARYLQSDSTDYAVQKINDSGSPFRFTKFWVEDQQGNVIKTTSTGKKTSFVLQYESETKIESLSIAMGVFDLYGCRVTHVSMLDRNMEINSSVKGQVKCVFEKLPFTAGRYVITLGAYSYGLPVVIQRHAVGFAVNDDDYFGEGAVKGGLRLGPVMVNHEWIWEEVSLSK